MFLNFIAVNEKILNLNAVALIEDQSTDTEPIALVRMIDGDDFTFEGPDAQALFDRSELIIAATEQVLFQMQNAGIPQGGGQ